MSGILKPSFRLIYRGTDISGDLDPMTTDVSYSDNGHGEQDEISVTVQDSDGRWKGSWRPETGDVMDLTIFDGRGGMLQCGSFELDEPEASGSRSGDIMAIRGLSAPITKALRTEKSRAFENQSLNAVVKKVAGENGLSIEGQIDDLQFKRISQRRERDLEFLTRLAEDTGHYFTVKGKRAIFTNFKSIDGQSPVLKIFHGDNALLDYSFKEQTDDTFSKAKVSYLDADKKEVVKQEVADPNVKTGDELKISGERVESEANAKALAASRLHFKNRARRSGSISMVGATKLVSGVVVEAVSFGKYSGLYVVKTSGHGVTRGGYTCNGELVDARAS